MVEGPGHPFLELIRRRSTVEAFDSERELSEELIRELIEDTTYAPSSFNIQHWRFIAVRDLEDRRRLREVAYGQSHVEEAPVTFIVLGDLRGAEKLPQVLQRAVDSGAMPRRRAASWLRFAERIYADPEMARDEAIRSASLAAMILMLSAEARGLASGALSGFDPEGLRREFHIDERYVPVMLVAVGHPAVRDEQRKPRLAVDEVLAFDRGREF